MRFRWALLLVAAALLPAAASAQVSVTRRGPADVVPAPALGSDRAAPDPIADPGRFSSFEHWRRRPRAPRAYPAPRDSRPSIVTQLAAGLYNPGGSAATSFLLSARIGPRSDPHARLGFMLDWAHKSDRASVTFGHETVGGVDLSLEDSRLRGRSDLVPLLAFIEVGGDQSMHPIPYVGFGAGYEILSMEADRPNGARFEGTFGGWGGQVWAGAGLPLGGQARLNGEVFFNWADLGRDVNVGGRALRQTASFDGPGVRLGLAWGF